MTWASALTLAVTVLVAVGGYVATYVWNLKIAQRKDRLERVNLQLSQFYGPLLALATAGGRAFQVWRASASRFASWDDATEEDRAEWELWIRTVFMPLNRRMVDIVTTRADLLVGREMPQTLLDLAAHVWEYEALIARWDAGDRSKMVPQIIFPSDSLVPYVTDNFDALKREQASLLATRTAVGAR
jgi:hypothetical protein